MNLVTVIIRDRQGKPVRQVSCPPDDVTRQAGPGEVAAIATPADLAEHRAAVEAELSRARSFREVAEAPPTIETVLEALRAKGIDIKDADLKAAAATLQARRTPPAGAGK